MIEAIEPTLRQQTTRYVGIDSGLHGAVAVLLPDGSATCFDTPIEVVTMGPKKTKRNDYDVGAMRRLLVSALGDARNTCVVLENMHAMPHEGVRSVYMTGRAVAIWEGLCAGLGLPLRKVAPQTWKRHAGILNQEKAASRICAAGQFPTVDLGPRTHTGRSDALMIAVYGRACNY